METFLNTAASAELMDWCLVNTAGRLFLLHRPELCMCCVQLPHAQQLSREGKKRLLRIV